MKDYYQREHTFSEPSAPMHLTMIGSLFQGISFAFMFFTTLLYSIIGVKQMVVLGGFLISGGLLLCGQATSIWHLYIALSLCTGTGIATMQVITFRLLPSWFQKHRNMAFGIQTTMIPIGGLAYPNLMVYINKTLGPSWTFRIIGIFCCFTTIAGFMILRERQPITNTAEERRNVLQFRVLKNLNFIILMAIHPVQLYAQYIASTFIPLNATYLGLSDVNGAALVSIMSSTNIFGRLCGGLLADKIGGLNMFSIYMAVSTISLWVVWVLARDFTALIGFAIMNGFVNSCLGVISASVTMAITGPKDYPAATGLRPVLLVVSVFGPLVADLLESSNHAEPFLYCKIVAGAGAAMACILTLILKFRMDKRPFAKV
ncbi:major facilitator superfamily domain-containing protein [Fennellomyces sp. T-0311]|nr:major facilitator superfamily domain-containing protein [Fennellomyces sp. T-0311]